MNEEIKKEIQDSVDDIEKLYNQFKLISERKKFNINSKVFHIGALISSLISFSIIFFFPFNLPNKLAYGITFGCLTYLMIFKFLGKIKIEKILILRKRKKLFFFFFYFLILLYYLFNLIYPIDYHQIFIFPIIISTFLLTSFLPGYFLLDLFKIKNNINTYEKIIYSIIFSFLITGICGFIGWNFGSIETIGVLVLISLNIIIFIICIISFIKNQMIFKSKTEFMTVKINILNLSILLLLVIFLYLLYYTIHPSFLPLRGDEFRHIGLINKFLTDYYSWQQNQLDFVTSYPYLFHLYQAINVSISKVSITNIFILNSYLLLALPIFSFYILMRKITKSRNKSLLATIIYQIFSGFGWIFALFNLSNLNLMSETQVILESAISSADIIYSTWLPIINAPYLIDQSSFFLILTLILDKKMKFFSKITLMLPLLFLIIFCHLINLYFLLIIALGFLFCRFLFGKLEFLGLLEFGICLISSTLIIIFLDFFSYKQLFLIFPSIRNSLIVFILFGTILSIFSSINFENISIMRKMHNFFELNNKAFYFILSFFLIFIFLGIMIYELIFLDVTPSILFQQHFAFVPLNYYILKIGFLNVCFVFLIILIFKFNKEFILSFMNKTIGYLVLISFSSLIIIYHNPLIEFLGLNEILIEEFRYFRDFIWPMLSIISGVTLYFVLKKLHKKIKIKYKNTHLKSQKYKIIFVSSLLGLILGIAPLSHLLKIEYFTISIGYAYNEENVVKFISDYEIDSEAAIFTPYYLNDPIYAATGALIYSEGISYYCKLLAQNIDISTFLFSINYLNIKYAIIPNNNIERYQFFNFFPIIFNDDYYKFVKIPEISYPNLFCEGNSTLIYEDSNFDKLTETIMSLSIANVKYDINNNQTLQNLTKNYSNLIFYDYNRLNFSLDLNKESLSHKKVVILGDISESEWLKNDFNITYINESITLNQIEIQNNTFEIPIIHVPKTIINMTNNVVEWYSKTMKIPFILNISKVFPFDAIYININPFLESIKKERNLEDFNDLIGVFNEIFHQVIDLPIKDFQKRDFYQRNEGFIEIFGKVIIRGQNKQILTNNSVISALFYNTSSFSVDGSISIYSISYGNSLITVKGLITLDSNNFNLGDTYLKINFKNIEIIGLGTIQFSSLSSSFPYKLTSENSFFENYGNVNIELFPIKSNIFLILANEITGGTWESERSIGLSLYPPSKIIGYLLIILPTIVVLIVLIKKKSYKSYFYKDEE